MYANIYNYISEKTIASVSSKIYFQNAYTMDQLIRQLIQLVTNCVKLIFKPQIMPKDILEFWPFRVLNVIPLSMYQLLSNKINRK